MPNTFTPIARCIYDLPLEDGQLQSTEESEFGRLSDILVTVYHEWKRGNVERPYLHLSPGVNINPSVVTDIFDAMKIIEAQSAKR